MKKLRELNIPNKEEVVYHVNPARVRTKTQQVCGEVFFDLDIRDDVQKRIYFNAYEQDLLRQVRPFFPASGIVFDVGAHVGFYALNIAKQLRSGKVYAFEADPDNFARLRRNCALNTFGEKVALHNVAVSSHEGTVTFYRSAADHSGWGSLNRFEGVATRELPVSAVTLDRFVEREAIDRIDFMKIDVEAHEFEVIEGAARCLENKSIHSIFIEYNGLRLRERGYSFRDFLALFSKFDYHPAQINLDLARDLLHGNVASIEVCTNFLFQPLVRGRRID